MIRQLSFFILLFFFLPLPAGGQSYEILGQDRTVHIMDRLDILSTDSTLYFTSTRNFKRKNLFDRAYVLKNSARFYSENDLGDLKYLLTDNIEWADKDIRNSLELELFKPGKKPFLKYFYNTPAHFYELSTPDFQMVINPVLHFQFGEAANNEELVFQNTRGFEIRGIIDNKVYFFTNLFENQRRFNDYIEDRIFEFNAIPGQGFYKPFESKLFDQLDGWDYLNAQAYVGFPISKSIEMQFGHGKNFIGHGIRSLLLSDYGNNYFYLKFNSRFWKLHFQNIFAELSAIGSLDNLGNTLLPKKYMAAHYLDFAIHPNFNLGFFESVIFSRIDHFEFQYLNPVIIYRTVESLLDSPDNVLIGFNFKWNLLNRIQCYGQAILDEFKFDQFSRSNGWWGNKYGVQLGIKYMNAFNIDHLDIQLEYNMVRPYTYAHSDTLQGFDTHTIASYSHYNQPLAHPLGANFNEWIFKFRYQPRPSIIFDGRYVSTRFGDDIGAENWGGNILNSYLTRVQDFENSTTQGDLRTIHLFALDIEYEIRHNYFIDFHVLLRNQSQEQALKNRNTKYFGLGFRINISEQALDY